MVLDSDRVIEQIASASVVDDERTRLYVTHLDRMLDRHLAMPAGCWKDPGNRSQWPDVRSYGALGAAAAFLFRLPQSRHHRSPAALDLFRDILVYCMDQQNDLGAIADEDFPPHPGSSHGQSWALENLLFGLMWVGDDLDPELRARADRACYRCADFIAARPVDEANNRGVIVCAAMALCGRYFREQRFIDLAMLWFHREPARVFDERSGQILEGSAPDGNYSGTTYEYLYLYRIMSGDVRIDRHMVAALKWYSRVLTPRGDLMLMGPSSRVPLGSSVVKIHDILSSLERYSADEPFFSALIDQYMPLMLEKNSIGALGHSGSPTIWALLEHQPVRAVSAPAWYTDMRTWCRSAKLGPEHLGYNEGYESLYFPIRRRYTTSVAMRSRSPFKDIQAWALDHEAPVVYPAKQYASKTTGWALDTAVMNTSGIKIPLFCWVRGEDSFGLMGRWESYWRFYVFAPTTMLVLGAGEVGATQVRWVIDTAICGSPVLQGTTIRYDKRAGMLHLPKPPSRTRDDESVIVHDFDFADASTWFAFSDGSFAMERAEPGRLAFTDADGRWEVQYSYDPGGADLTEKLTSFPHVGQKHLMIRRI